MTAADAPRREGVRVTVATPDDWRPVRHLRLAALADTPDAFGSTLEQEADRDEASWRGWLDRPDVATFVASLVGEDGESRTAGLTTIAAVTDETPRTAGMYSVWVAPSVRGRGVGDALLAAAVAHARAAGYARIVLDVGDHNTPAQALYARHGFTPTGRTTRFAPPREHLIEHELALDLRP